MATTAGSRPQSRLVAPRRASGARAIPRSRVVACEDAHASGALTAGVETRAPRGSRTGGAPPAFEGDGAKVLRLRKLVEELGDLALSSWTDLPEGHADEVVQLLERSSRAIASIQAGAIAALAKQEQDHRRGSRNLNERVATTTGRSKAASFRAVRAAEQMDKHLPETRRALARGEISEDHVNAIVTWATKTEKHRERLKDPHNGERHLVEQARTTGAAQFVKIAKGWATETDPKAADREFHESSRNQAVNLTPVDEGFLLKGILNHVDGQILQTALAAHMGRKATDDERSFPQRRAEALIGLARQSLDEGKQMRGARIRPHLTVTLDYLTLERLVQATGHAMPEATFFAHRLQNADDSTREAAYREWAKAWQPGDDHVISTKLDYATLTQVPAATLPDGTPLAPAALARLACESMLARVVFGPESTILDAGREERIFPAHQVRAIIARDRICQYPGCDEGPEFSEVHHSLEWYKHGGTTHADLGILLCYSHHSHVHRRGITIARIAGQWIFTDSQDQQITAPNPGTQPTSRAVRQRAPALPPDPGDSSVHASEAPPGAGVAGRGPQRAGPPRVVISAGDPLCPDVGEQAMLNFDQQPPF